MGLQVHLLFLGVLGVVLGSPTLYNERQEGKYNVRGDVSDSTIIIIPSKDLMNIGLTMLGKSSGQRRMLGQSLLNKLGFGRSSLSPYAVDLDRSQDRVQPLSPDLNLVPNVIPTVSKEEPAFVDPKKELIEDVAGSFVAAEIVSTADPSKDVVTSGTLAPSVTKDDIISGPVAPPKRKDDSPAKNGVNSGPEAHPSSQASVGIDSSTDSLVKVDAKGPESGDENVGDLKKKLEKLKTKEETGSKVGDKKTESNKTGEMKPVLDKKEGDLKKKTTKMVGEVLTLIQSGIEECGPDGHRDSQGVCIFTPEVTL